FGKLTNVKKIKALEKPAGQWNTYEIVAEGDTVTLIINGEQVNKATGCDLDAGKICLTSEGDEIHFRNMTVSVTSR
ncbi:MAG: 3-keto-disaccharide hydrolase, partial [Planctomycetota bacterium]